MFLGIDVGSTTIKGVVLNDEGKLEFSVYRRHFSQIREKTIELLSEIKEKFNDEPMGICISGSAGMGMAESCGIPFIQEVYATRVAVNKLYPETDVVIELGGEDAKVLFLTNGLEVRMNGTCAGGTGAFIDQMSSLLNMTPDEMNEAAKSSEKRYSVASRCGVFAKTDVQPLLNQGAKKSDVASSIFYAVANQTVAGLAQGRPIVGNVLYLGGPLTFLSELRTSFNKVLKLEGTLPENSLYFVAMGAAFSTEEEIKLSDAITKIEDFKGINSSESTRPLFETPEDYEEFKARHEKDRVEQADPDTYTGKAYLGVDAGSTTIKATIIDENENILISDYRLNSGNPVPLVREFLINVYKKYPDIKICGAASTGYGEDIIRNAFMFDDGIVETMAHYMAAKKFNENVDFIIDIGGQDIKCFKIRNGAIDNIFLNEACSSGCGSFLQTFANALGYDAPEFAKLGLMADAPVDLGSRCTVFMNSSVKQAQKDGVSVENISAGLSMSVVKNAIYKVIRVADASYLGENIVVQGGTFLNDAVLRAFELEIGRNVARPNIAGLMGAYGTAIYAKKKSNGESTILNLEALENFVHNVKVVQCGLCNNNCRLTVNEFDGGRKYIGGNRCERPIAKKSSKEEKLNLYEYKRQLLDSYKSKPGKRGKIGIPMGLNMYELLPLWHTLFTELDFEVVTSPKSNRKLYLKGQYTIPSDTVCFPAKLVHGHIEALLDEKVDIIFYPCLAYNFDEKMGENFYNCPVVAYYPEVLHSNVTRLEKETRFIYDYLTINSKEKLLEKLYKIFKKDYSIKKSELRVAIDKAFDEYEKFMKTVKEMADVYIEKARERGLPIIVLAGRPYHIDPETSHGIDELVCSMPAAVVTEDSVFDKVESVETGVLNQWTYHSRMYAAAKYVCTQEDMNLVQMVSFGCGVDAVTTDEVREILEHKDKLYTQIKIDEITNLGALRIRLRSLFAALDLKKENKNVTHT
ncbi:MAG: 2-hydroxyacyl-CoA dehydratase [Clostridia bacterium]|nr:2-hydroxyacyl-CoA dehydratase [Clostridia bacterium]